MATKGLIVVFLLVVTIVVTVNSRLLSRERRREKMLANGLAIFKGNFVYKRYTFTDAKDAPPEDNVRIVFRKKGDKEGYIYKDGDGRLCLMTAEPSINELTVIKSRECPFPIGSVLKFNQTGVTMPDGRFFDRNFRFTSGRKYCNTHKIKLLQCQKEDFNRTMLENARLTWTEDVWYDFGDFLQKHLCICNLKARYNYFPYFTISFYGQCQGVDQIGEKTEEEGCIDGGYQNCDIGTDTACAGKGGYDAIYEVIYEDDNTDVDFFEKRGAKKDAYSEGAESVMSVWRDFFSQPNQSDQFHNQN